MKRREGIALKSISDCWLLMLIVWMFLMDSVPNAASQSLQFHPLVDDVTVSESIFLGNHKPHEWLRAKSDMALPEEGRASAVKTDDWDKDNDFAVLLD